MKHQTRRQWLLGWLVAIVAIVALGIMHGLSYDAQAKTYNSTQQAVKTRVPAGYEQRPPVDAKTQKYYRCKYVLQSATGECSIFRPHRGATPFKPKN